MLWYCYPYDCPDIFDSSSGKSHFDTGLILASHPNVPALHLWWRSCSQFSPIYSSQAQHIHMHMIHINNTHATFKGRVKKYDEIQANSLGWLNPSCSSLLKLGRPWPVSCLCRTIHFLIKLLVPLGFTVYKSPIDIDRFWIQCLFFCISGLHSEVMPAFSTQLPRQTNLSHTSSTYPWLEPCPDHPDVLQLLKSWIQFDDFSKTL